jgi:Ca2+-binding RTX toxin-like protein
MPAFGIEYSGDTLWGYSPDPDFVQSTRINATLNGSLDDRNWTLLGGTGDDSIIGANQIGGGANGDFIVGDRSPVGAQSYYQGQDTIVGSLGNNTIYGDSIGDVGQGNADSIVGGINSDTIYGGGGNDTILAADNLAIDSGDNLIEGNDGNDSIVGGAGNDDIYGGNGDDDIVGSLGADSLFGGDGNDDFQFANSDFGSAATIDGGAGSNTLSFTNAAIVVDSQFANKSNIDIITTPDGFNSDITLGSNAGSGVMGLNSVIGGNGDDTFALASTFTTTGQSLYGGAGNDDFTVNSYSQISSGYIDGGANTDTLNIVTSLGASNSYEPIVSTNVSNIEILQLGETATNYVNIGDSNGDWGIASVYGGANVDNNINAAAIGVSINLFGGNNSDQLIAGSNGDVIQGWLATTNTSNDTLTGGTGNDDFVLGNNTDNAYGQPGGGSPIAYIRDFDAGGDILTVSSFGGTVVAGDYNTDSVGVPVGYNTRLFLNSSNTDTIAFLNVSGVFNTATDLNVVV